MLNYCNQVKICTLNKMNEGKKIKVCIVVLGDVGRSPRMQYHGLSFAKEGYKVRFLGYSGAEPIKPLRENPNVTFQYLYDCPDFKTYLPTVLAYVFKVIWQVITLFIALLMAGFPDYVLVQNPPAVPALGVCCFYCKIFRSKFIIDWHNYAHTILALSVGDDHLLVKISKNFELYFGRKADNCLCVTKAMKEDLENTYGIKAVTFYDRPPEFFKSPTVEERHKLFLSMSLEYPDVFLKNSETVFTEVLPGVGVVLRDDRPGLIVSSTSWTLDEDISILLEALDEYDKSKTEELPSLVCAITGKGPLKKLYKEIIKKRKWKHVQVITPWLAAEDYPVFLGSADLGICLHKSSSGLDLPMKVVDMFGCSVPVCATDFQCLNELVKHEENGFVFNSGEELLSQLKRWFTGFPQSESELRKTFEENLKHFQSLRWHDNWKFNVQPLFKRI